MVTLSRVTAGGLPFLQMAAGGFGYGSGPLDRDNFPAGTFNFGDVIDQLLQRIAPVASEGSGCYFSLMEPHSSATQAQVIGDASAVLRWFEGS